MASITLPGKLTEIKSDTFYGCTGLTSVNLPDSVTSIGANAFYNCSALANLNFPESLTAIGESAFYGCMNLTQIAIPESMIYLAEGTFMNCTGLQYVTIPDEIMYIEANVFSGCTAIDTVYYEGSQPLWNEMVIYDGNTPLTDANIVYAAPKLTYHFVTNCDTVLPDLTDYYIAEKPVLSAPGKIFSGWYDNEQLLGYPLDFPYFGTATTLYAAWADKTGTSFSDAIAIEANASYMVTATAEDELTYYEFIPNLTGEYTFYATGTLDTYGILYDSNQAQLSSADDNGEGNNFSISYVLTAGETYYIAVKSVAGTGTFQLVTETDCVGETTTVCVTAANGETIFITLPSYLPEDAEIILACYQGTKLVETQSAPNQNETIYFPVSKSFDSAKVMVWDSFDTLAPICVPEIVE